MQELKHYLRLYEYPFCAREALGRLEQLCCHGNSVPQQQRLIQEIMEEFIFCDIDRRGIRKQRLNAVQELQLLDSLSSYFEEQKNQMISNTMFLTLFHRHEGGASIYKMNVLTKLVSMAISTKSVATLNCTAVWMQQQGCTSDVVVALAQELVKDFLQLFPKAISHLNELPEISVQFTAHFITAVTPMYGRIGDRCLPPPVPLLKCITQWIATNPQLCLAPMVVNLQGALPKGSIVMPASVVLPGLVRWCVEGPLLVDGTEKGHEVDSVYSQLHLVVLESMMEMEKLRDQMVQKDVMFVRDFALICESLAVLIMSAEIKAMVDSDERIRLSLDRLAQGLQIMLSTRCLQGNLDELLPSVTKLPPSRLLQMVLYQSKSMM